MKKLARYFSFKGRTSRLAYWRLQVALVLLIAVFWCGGFLLAEATGIDGLSALGFVALVPLFWIALALLFRRLHDRNKSGWWSVPFYFAPLALTAVEASLRDQGAEATLGIVALAGFALAVWAFIEVGLMAGTRGQNRFGPDPRAA